MSRLSVLFVLLFIFQFPLLALNRKHELADQNSKIVLTDNIPFEKQVIKENIIYIINSEIKLGSDFVVPSGCTFLFQGGKITGTKVLTSFDTKVICDDECVFSPNLVLKGRWHSNDVNPESFGAKGDGLSNDTQPLSNLGKFSGDINFLKNRTYLINSSVYLSGNTSWNMNGCTIMLMYNCNASPIFIKNVDNVTIKNGFVLGAKASDSKWQEYGINIQNAQNIEINNMSISFLSRDGVYIGYEWTNQGEETHKNCNIVVKDSRFYDIGRNGIVVSSGDDVLIKGCEFRNITLNPPASGIDVEPENSNVQKEFHINNLHISDCIFHSCVHSIHLYGSPQKCNNGTVYINHIQCSNGSSIVLSSDKENAGYQTSIEDVSFINSHEYCILLRDVSRCCKTNISDVKVYSPDRNHSNGNVLKIVHANSNSNDLGGFKVSDVRIIDTEGVIYKQPISYTCLNNNQNVFLQDVAIDNIKYPNGYVNVESSLLDLFDKFSFSYDYSIPLLFSVPDGGGWYRIAQIIGNRSCIRISDSDSKDNYTKILVKFKKTCEKVRFKQKIRGGCFVNYRLIKDCNDIFLEAKLENGHNCNYVISSYKGHSGFVAISPVSIDD